MNIIKLSIKKLIPCAIVVSLLGAIILFLSQFIANQEDLDDDIGTYFYLHGYTYFAYVGDKDGIVSEIPGDYLYAGHVLDVGKDISGKDFEGRGLSGDLYLSEDEKTAYLESAYLTDRTDYEEAFCRYIREDLWQTVNDNLRKLSEYNEATKDIIIGKQENQNPPEGSAYAGRPVYFYLNGHMFGIDPIFVHVNEIPDGYQYAGTVTYAGTPLLGYDFEGNEDGEVYLSADGTTAYFEFSRLKKSEGKDTFIRCIIWD